MTPDEANIAVIQSLVLQVVFLSAFCGYVCGAATFGFVLRWVEIGARFVRRIAFRAKRPS